MDTQERDNTGTPLPAENEVKNVEVPEYQLQALIDQNMTMKADIGQLVSLLQSFTTLFSGKTSIAGLIPVITKLMNNKEQLQQMSAIVPIIEKYSNPVTNG